MKRRSRNLLIVAVFAPWVVVPVVGALVGRELANPKSRTAYAIAGAAIGWFGLAVVLRSVLFLRKRIRRRQEPQAPQIKHPTAPPDYDDPGWPIGMMSRGAVLPGWGALRLRRMTKTNGLIALRAFYMALIISPLLLIYVLTQVHPSRAAAFRPATAAIVVALVGVQSLVAGRAWRRRSLPPDSAAELIKRYRALFFLQFSSAESPILVGFVGFFLTGGHLWIYGVGLAFGMVGLLAMAPTQRSIQRRQAELAAAGSILSLGSLLLRPPRETA